MKIKSTNYFQVPHKSKKDNADFNFKLNTSLSSYWVPNLGYYVNFTKKDSISPIEYNNYIYVGFNISVLVDKNFIDKADDEKYKNDYFFSIAIKSDLLDLTKIKKDKDSNNNMMHNVEGHVRFCKDKENWCYFPLIDLLDEEKSFNISSLSELFETSIRTRLIYIFSTYLPNDTRRLYTKTEKIKSEKIFNKNGKQSKEKQIKIDELFFYLNLMQKFKYYVSSIAIEIIKELNENNKNLYKWYISPEEEYNFGGSEIMLYNFCGLYLNYGADFHPIYIGLNPNCLNSQLIDELIKQNNSYEKIENCFFAIDIPKNRIKKDKLNCKQSIISEERCLYVPCINNINDNDIDYYYFAFEQQKTVISDAIKIIKTYYDSDQ